MKLKKDKEIKSYVIEGEVEEDYNPFVTTKNGVVGKVYDGEKKLYVPKEDKNKQEKKNKVLDNVVNKNVNRNKKNKNEKKSNNKNNKNNNNKNKILDDDVEISPSFINLPQFTSQSILYFDFSSQTDSSLLTYQSLSQNTFSSSYFLSINYHLNYHLIYSTLNYY